MSALFQHRHYTAIAKIIAELPADVYGIEQVAIAFAKALQGTNPAFDPTRFYSAAIGAPTNGRDR